MSYTATATRNHLGLHMHSGFDLHSICYSNDIYNKPIYSRDIPWAFNEKLPLGKIIGTKKYECFDVICRQAVADGFVLTAMCDIYSCGKRQKKLVVDGTRMTKEQWDKTPPSRGSSKTYILINGKIH
jgi:hypothetical protein